MKKLYILFLAAILLTLAACLTACSAGPAVSMADDSLLASADDEEDAEKKQDTVPQEYGVRLDHVYKENYAEDDRLLVKGSYEVFQLEQGTGGIVTTSRAAGYINDHFNQWRKDQLQFLADVTEMARDSYASVGGVDPRWEQPEYVYSDVVTTDYWAGARLLCVSMNYISYSGGAHPNSWRMSVSFDLNDGRYVKITDLTDDPEGMRDAVAENLMYQIKKSQVWAEVGEEGFFEDYPQSLQEWMDHCLVFGDSGITVVYNPYTLAPYAAGAQTFQVPYSLLKPYLNGRGLRLLGLDQVENQN